MFLFHYIFSFIELLPFGMFSLNLNLSEHSPCAQRDFSERADGLLLLLHHASEEPAGDSSKETAEFDFP